MSRMTYKNNALQTNASRAQRKTSKVLLVTEPAPVVWVAWQIRPGEKYLGVIQRADRTIERTRLERDDLQAAADFVTAHKMGKAASIRGRKLRRVR